MDISEFLEEIDKLKGELRDQLNNTQQSHLRHDLLAQIDALDKLRERVNARFEAFVQQMAKDMGRE